MEGHGGNEWSSGAELVTSASDGDCLQNRATGLGTGLKRGGERQQGRGRIQLG